MQGANAPSRGTPSYFDEIRRFPVLKAEEEYLLAEPWRDGGDASAAHRLLTSHLRLVAKVAMGYRRYGLSTSDLISKGNIGLMRALSASSRRRVFGSRPMRFGGSRRRFKITLRSWSLVGISTTVNQKKLFFNLVTAKRQRSVFREGDLRPQRVSLIAAGLGVAANDVVDMNRRLSGDISLNVSLNQDGFRGVARPAGGRKYRPAPSY